MYKKIIEIKVIEYGKEIKCSLPYKTSAKSAITTTS